MTTLCYSVPVLDEQDPGFEFKNSSASFRKMKTPAIRCLASSLVIAALVPTPMVVPVVTAAPVTKGGYVSSTGADGQTGTSGSGQPAGFSRTISGSSGTDLGFLSPASVQMDRGAEISSIVYSEYPDESFSANQIFELRSSGKTVGEAYDGLKAGQMLVRATHISVLPLARAHLDFSQGPGINTGASDLGLPGTQLGEEAAGECVARVLASKSELYSVGDLVFINGHVWNYRVIAETGEEIGFFPVSVPDEETTSTNATSKKSHGAPKRVIPPRKLPPGVPPGTFLSAFTVPAGITSYLAFKKSNVGKIFLQEKAENPTVKRTVVVSSAAGAVGVIMAQLYKNNGDRVIGITSTVAKATRLVDEFGLDAAVAYKDGKAVFSKKNYDVGRTPESEDVDLCGDNETASPSTTTSCKSSTAAIISGTKGISLLAQEDEQKTQSSRRSFDTVLREAIVGALELDTEEGTTTTPSLIDLFIDNVGGAQLDGAMTLMKPQGKILTVGAMSEIENYASGKVRGCKEYLRMSARELLWGGFMVIPEAIGALGQLLGSGKLKTAETYIPGKSVGDWLAADDSVHASQGFGRSVLVLEE
ncbi:unnamed protein product [Amoebophrya sp. A25]|nr:unnamed protein product [Amoebophrya sp. A25]|eukprot:GSA25T00006698001.1